MLFNAENSLSLFKVIHSLFNLTVVIDTHLANLYIKFPVYILFNFYSFKLFKEHEGNFH